MFKKNKKAMILTALILSVFLLAGCGGQSEGNAQGNVDETEATVSSQESQASSSGHHGEGNGQQQHQRNGSNDIGQEAAIAIVVAKVPGATAADIVEMERECDDGNIEYEGELLYGGYQYEFEIDGITGNILKWEIDD